jgi:hypothetical protein
LTHSPHRDSHDLVDHYASPGDQQVDDHHHDSRNMVELAHRAGKAGHEVHVSHEHEEGVPVLHMSTWKKRSK